MSRGWAKASACRFQITLSCAFLCHIVSLQYLSLHRLALLPCRIFLSHGLQVVPRDVHRSSLRRLICPAQDHFIVLTVLISMTFVLSLAHMLVFLSLYVMLSFSFHFGLYGSKFVLGLFGQCLGLCTVWHSWQHTGVVHLSLQADGKVVFKDVPVFGVCRPACHDSSLYLFVLVIFLEAVVLSQVHAALDIFYQHILLLLLLLTLGHVHYRVSTFATIIDHTFLSSVIDSSRPCSLMSLLILSIHLMRGLPLGLFQVFPYQAQFLSLVMSSGFLRFICPYQLSRRLVT